jgi:hypothetical protein
MSRRISAGLVRHWIVLVPWRGRLANASLIRSPLLPSDQVAAE